MALLRGLDEIADYAKRNPAIIKKWASDEKMKFPAKKIDGIWQSETTLIDDWYRMKIKPAPTGERPIQTRW